MEPTLFMRGVANELKDVESYKQLPLWAALALLAFELSHLGRALPILAWVFRWYRDSHPRE